MACYLTQLPSEILHNILTYVEPQDLRVLPLVCRYLTTYLKDNSALCRAIYYRILDDPPKNENLDWVQEIHDLVRLQSICTSEDIDKGEVSFVCNTVTRLLEHASPEDHVQREIRSVTYAKSRNTDWLTKLFSSSAVQDAFFARSLLFDRARGAAGNFQEPPKLEHQQSAKLHCLYGVPLLKFGRTRSTRMYPFACSKVYDLRQYTPATHWGPFMNDGSDRVDWEKVEAIMLVLGNNIKDRGLDRYPIFSNFWTTPFAGSWPKSYIRWPPAEAEAAREGGEGETEVKMLTTGPEDDEAAEEARISKQLQLDDPYEVSGTWLRVVCFLDYNDFFRYNFPPADEIPDNVPRPALERGEATRVILMKIHVTQIEYAEGESAESGAWPVVHFRGFSRSLDASWDDNANSDLRGTASMTPEGEVRWTTFSIFGGVERWRSESIQVGGPKSAKGVIGNWFEKDYDPQGPCGPTAFWKISDHEPNSEDLQVLRDDFLSIVDGDDGGMHDPDYDHGHEHEYIDDDDDDDDEDLIDGILHPNDIVLIPIEYMEEGGEDDEGEDEDEEDLAENI
ncbi:hypothetical protein GQ53DRAFT_187850 [Thozetella sp. PMI_491]|nr:hypothetical protein GQ53DRAFT_187850 [Thozetella sp. PMI_491]